MFSVEDLEKTCVHSNKLFNYQLNQIKPSVHMLTFLHWMTRDCFQEVSSVKSKLNISVYK